MLKFDEFKIKLTEELTGYMSSVFRNAKLKITEINGTESFYFDLDDGKEPLYMGLISVYEQIYVAKTKGNFAKAMKLIGLSYEKQYKSDVRPERNDRPKLEQNIEDMSDDSSGQSDHVETKYNARNYETERNMEEYEAQESNGKFTFSLDRVFYCVVNLSNADKLNDIPHKYKGDIAVYLRYLISLNDGVIESAIIDNEQLEVLSENGFDFDRLFEAAQKNTPKIFPSIVDDIAPGVYLVSNKYYYFGSATLIYPEGPLEVLANLTKSHLVVLPFENDFFVVTESPVAQLDEDMYKQYGLGIRKYSKDFDSSALSSHPYIFDAEKKILLLDKESIVELEYRPMTRNII